jgi:hypothetical protein
VNPGHTGLMRMLTVAVASLTLASPALAVTHKPTLILERARVVHGSSFAPRETVRIVLLGESSWVKTVRATAAGDFHVSLQGAPIPRCAVYVVRATGSHGSKASLTVRPPECNSQ